MLRPEMIIGLLLEMATGDENMPKGGQPDDLAMLTETDKKLLFGPRAGHNSRGRRESLAS